MTFPEKKDGASKDYREDFILHTSSKTIEVIIIYFHFFYHTYHEHESLNKAEKQ